MIVLDTNVLSELLRALPEPAVVRWTASQALDTLFTTAVTQAEMLYRVKLLAAGQRRQQLEGALATLFAEDFFRARTAVRWRCSHGLRANRRREETDGPSDFTVRCADRRHCTLQGSPSRHAQRRRLRRLRPVHRQSVADVNSISTGQQSGVPSAVEAPPGFRFPRVM